jgi:hypothetical protein
MDLPFEIDLAIFQNLDSKSLLLCQHVCKSWSSPAQSLVYEHVHVHGDNSEKS